jgi:ATP-dependent DNA helicase RecG
VETGTRANVVEDVMLSGNIPLLIGQARELIAAKLGTVNRLGPTGKFEAIPVLPEFAWLEAIVNAVTHRSYSLQGDGVRVRDFEDRLEVESPLALK